MVYLQYERIIRFHHEPGKGHYIIYFTLNERAVQVVYFGIGRIFREKAGFICFHCSQRFI